MAEDPTIGGHSRWFRLAVLFSVLFVLFASILAVGAVDAPGPGVSLPGQSSGESIDGPSDIELGQDAPDRESDRSEANRETEGDQEGEGSPSGSGESGRVDGENGSAGTGDSQSGSSGTGGNEGSAGSGGFGALNPGDSTGVGGETGFDDETFGSNDTSVHFRVESSAPAYWRTGSYDTYTGTGWERPDSASPYDGPISHAGPTGERIDYRVILERPARALPTVWRPRTVSGVEGLRVTDDGALRSGDPLGPGTTFSGVSHRSVRDPGLLRSTDQNYPAEVAQRYTQLPSDTPDRVETFTTELTRDDDTAFDTAVTVQTWLRASKDYSLEASQRSPHMADTFIFEMDAGYCEYFATSMVAMLRSQDIPSRYVVGYSTGQRVAEDTYEVRGMNAHAWVEVYFEGVGWVQFDPTPSGPRQSAQQAALSQGSDGGGQPGQGGQAGESGEGSAGGDSGQNGDGSTDGEQSQQTGEGGEGSSDGTNSDGGDSTEGTNSESEEGSTDGTNSGGSDQSEADGGEQSGDGSEGETGESGGTSDGGEETDSGTEGSGDGDNQGSDGQGDGTDDRSGSQEQNEESSEEEQEQNEEPSEEEREQNEEPSEEDDEEETIPGPPYEITVSPEPFPGQNVTVAVEKDGVPIEGVEVSFNDEVVGITDAAGEVEARVPYANEITVSVQPPQADAATLERVGTAASGTTLAGGTLFGPATSLQSGTNSSVTYEIPTNVTVESSELVVPDRTVTASMSLNGSAVSGLEVIVDDESVGTTDENGNFTLPVPAGTALGDDLPVRFERDEFVGVGNVSVADVEIEIDTGFLKLPGTSADLTVTAVDGERASPLEKVPIRTNGGEVVAVTDGNGTAAMTLPWANEGTATAIVGENAVTASVSGMLLHLLAVVALPVMALVGAGVWVRRNPDRVRRIKRRAVGALVTAGEWVRVIGHRVYTAAIALQRRLLALADRVRGYFARLREGITVAALLSPVHYFAALARSLVARVLAFPDLIRDLLSSDSPEHTEVDGLGSESTATAESPTGSETEAIPAYRRLRQCWQWLVRRVVGRSRTKTAVEVERRAVEKGFPLRPVRRLRRAFQDVEYGFSDPEDRVEAAEESVERLRTDTEEREQ